MSLIATIATDEWRYWRRSRLAITVMAVGMILAIGSALLTAGKMSAAAHERAHLQAEAEETFYNQPDRHPHRMVHYGHYVFRAPPPLAVFDPGVDAVTGQSIFLEGHHQNTAMFADGRAEARTGGFGNLSAAKIYQLFMTLLLIAIGHAVLIRERENRTLGTLLAQGLTGPQILAGKGLALMGVGLLMSIPALCLSIYAALQGEALSVALGMYLGYLLFLSVWVALILFISVRVKTRGLALGGLLIIWFASSLIIPRLGVAATSALMPMDGKFQTDMRMTRDIRALGDGHNASDPAFAKLKADMLAKYNADDIDELPLNYRGLVAEVNEKELTDVMNRYAETRMTRELEQSHVLRSLSFLSPFVAIDYSSRHLAGTDLPTHHRFLREAEAVRYDFVMGLNQAHKEKLDYGVDINRNNGEAGSRAARISADNWSVLNEFRFTADPAGQRISRAALPFGALLLWMGLLLGAAFSRARRIMP